MSIPHDPQLLTQLLAGAGFVAADEEAEELLAFTSGDTNLLEVCVRRRLDGEPLAWITGSITFCELSIAIDPGVYVPRWQSEPLARRAVERMTPLGTAIDLCTGAGAIAATLSQNCPGTRVLASELDARAVACAEKNGVEVYQGDLFAPLAAKLDGRVDLVVGVVPYVPTSDLSMLPRDTLRFESPLSYDGGERGTRILHRVIAESPRFLRRGGALLLELGGDQAEVLNSQLEHYGFIDIITFSDDDGDVRGIEATFTPTVEVKIDGAK